MGLFSSIKDTVATKLLGELVTDLGTLPIDGYGGQMSLSIRRQPNRPPHLQVKVARTRESSFFQIACSREWADQFERVAREIRRQIDAPVDNHGPAAPGR